MASAVGGLPTMDANAASHGTMKIEKVRCLDRFQTMQSFAHLIVVQTEKRDALRAIEEKYQKQTRARREDIRVGCAVLLQFPAGIDNFRRSSSQIPKVLWFAPQASSTSACLVSSLTASQELWHIRKHSLSRLLDACADGTRYVNGVPHLSHAFTISKMDFAARVARAQGKNTLYPQGFHATGMPIKACADKLANEIAMFGETFSAYTDSDASEALASATSPQPRARVDVTKFTNVKKGMVHTRRNNFSGSNGMAGKAALKTTLQVPIPGHDLVGNRP